ncbi:MAG: bifunctional homocysteine S-methyltransferase/methylenetetrahydrofolate reductase [Planctomycetia bacterium]|nr:bifunctional homocysteine S-methyltransferase/methylenetetrahydrofolate reductase [Planctomycetia bacterium]
MRKSFKEALQQSVIVFDGAMGTEIYRNHIFTNRCYDELNLSNSTLIRQIHESYRNAGADVLTTNTFGANRLNLEKYGLADQLKAINLAGAALARSVAEKQNEESDRKKKDGNIDKTINNSTTGQSQTNLDSKCSEMNGNESNNFYVAGSIGPLFPSTPIQYTNHELEQILTEQISALIEGNVDFILFETQPSRKSMELAAKAMSHFNGFPFIISAALSQNKETVSGESVQRLFAPFPDELPQPFAFGLNCGLGPDGILESVEEIMKFVDRPFIVQPNAGLPKEFEGRQLYYCSPEYIATYSMQYVNLGVSAVGGCCGTTPEHIAEIAKMVKPLSKGRSAVSVLQQLQPEVQEQPESNFEDRSRLAWKFSHKKWIKTVELVPPRGYDLSDTIQKCQQISRFGIDAINLPDGPRASSRISSLVVAERILHEACIEPILHFCCRDRNLIGMQADLLACAAYGIHNLLFITGDPPKLGSYPNATGVFDTDSIGLCSLQQRMNRGIDLGGQAIFPQTHAVKGVGIDPNSLDLNREIARFRRKIEAGADFAITQPVFDQNQLFSFLEKVGDCSIPVIAGIWPLASYRNAVFMHNEVPGVIIPDVIMQRMEKASQYSKEDQLAIGIEIAKDSIGFVRDSVAGVQVSSPFGRIEIALNVLECF